MATNFPTQGDDKKISLRNSQYPQFDYDFIAGVKENDKDIYKVICIYVEEMLCLILNNKFYSIILK